jgi:hypothetical protein
MKFALFPIGLLALAASFAAAPSQPSAPQTCLLGLTDDPPPPVDDCPFCGGNPTLHRARFFAVQTELARISMRLVP